MITSRIHQTNNQQEAIMDSDPMTVMFCMFDDVARLKAIFAVSCQITSLSMVSLRSVYLLKKIQIAVMVRLLKATSENAFGAKQTIPNVTLPSL